MKGLICDFNKEKFLLRGFSKYCEKDGNIDVKIAKHDLEQSVGEELCVPAGLHAVVVATDEDAAGVGGDDHGLHRS